MEGRTFESVEVRGHTLAEGSIVTITFDDGRISASQLTLTNGSQGLTLTADA